MPLWTNSYQMGTNSFFNNKNGKNTVGGNLFQNGGYYQNMPMWGNLPPGQQQRMMPNTQNPYNVNPMRQTMQPPVQQSMQQPMQQQMAPRNRSMLAQAMANKPDYNPALAAAGANGPALPGGGRQHQPALLQDGRQQQLQVQQQIPMQQQIPAQEQGQQQMPGQQMPVQQQHPAPQDMTQNPPQNADTTNMNQGTEPYTKNGVTYYPITKGNIQQLIQSYNTPLIKEEPRGEESGPVVNEVLRETNAWEEAIQNEKNALSFYEYLRELAPGQNKEFLATMIGEKKNHADILTQLYKKNTGGDFNPAESKKDFKISYKQGVRWAIEEEGAAIAKLSEVYEQTENEEAAKRINAMLYKKVSRLSQLLLIV